jgi:biotin carboxylase
VEIWSITDRVTVTPQESLGVCLAHRYPSAHVGPGTTGHTQRITDLTAEVVRAFQLGGGPIYFQMLVGERGVLVNEVAFRLGGAYEDTSLPLVTGVDVLARQLSAIQGAVASRRGDESAKGSPGAAGGDHTARAVPTSSAFVVPLMFAHPGTIAELRGDEELRRRPEIAECRFLLPVGTTIRRMSNSTQRIACAVIHGADASAVNRGVDRVFDTLKVLDSAGENLLIDSRAAVKLPDL